MMPIASGWTKMKKSVGIFLVSKREKIITTTVIAAQAGKIQISKANMAMKVFHFFCVSTMMVWVEAGPGSI